MVNVASWFRGAAVALALSASVPAAQAAMVTYLDDRAGFLAATGAISIGTLPTGVGPVSSRVVGDVSLVTDSGSLYFGDFSTRVPGNEMIISLAEHFHATLSGGVYSFGFDLYEPTFGGGSGCNTTCVDTEFSIEIMAGATSLGVFAYNAPDDNGVDEVVALGFVGVHSDVPFDRVVIRDVTAHSDNEMFANFLKGTTSLPPSSAPGGSWGRLKILYR